MLFFTALLVAGSAVTALFLFPTSWQDFACTVAMVMAFEVTGFALHALWSRITRKRRREELMG